MVRGWGNRLELGRDPKVDTWDPVNQIEQYPRGYGGKLSGIDALRPTITENKNSISQTHPQTPTHPDKLMAI